MAITQKMYADDPLAPPSVELMLDRPRHLRWNLNTLIALKKATGKNPLDPKQLFEILGVVEGRDDEGKPAYTVEPDVENTRLLVWACCVDEDPTVTQEYIGRFIGGFAKMTEAMGAVTKAKGMADGQGELIERPTGAAESAAG